MNGHSVKIPDLPRFPRLPGLASSSGWVAAKPWNVEVDWVSNQSAWRRRRQRSRATRLAVTLALPVALGLVIGAVIAFYSGSSSANVAGSGPSPLGSVPAATATGPVVAVDANNVNCDIIVPANPLTAKGLATPYQLTGTHGMSPAQSGCAMTNAVN